MQAAKLAAAAPPGMGDGALHGRRRMAWARTQQGGVGAEQVS
jgi:hypothetical protein